MSVNTVQVCRHLVQEKYLPVMKHSIISRQALSMENRAKSSERVKYQDTQIMRVT